MKLMFSMYVPGATSHSIPVDCRSDSRLNCRLIRGDMDDGGWRIGNDREDKKKNQLNA